MHQQLNERAVDLNPQETAEWIESIEQVLDEAGPDRAAYLLDQITEHARRSGFPANKITEVRRMIDPTTATDS